MAKTSARKAPRPLLPSSPDDGKTRLCVLEGIAPGSRFSWFEMVPPKTEALLSSPSLASPKMTNAL